MFRKSGGCIDTDNNASDFEVAAAGPRNFYPYSRYPGEVDTHLPASLTGTALAVDIQRVVSPSGIEAWLVEEDTVPLIAMSFAFVGGAAQDPAERYPDAAALAAEIAQWDKLIPELLAREIGREDHVVHVRPELVVEVAFDGLQRSPRYPAGLALRFARVRRYRADKTADTADTLETVRAIYDGQRAPGRGPPRSARPYGRWPASARASRCPRPRP